MADLQEFLKEVKSGVATLVEQFATGQVHDAIHIAENLLGQSTNDLKRWTQLLAERQLTEAEYRSLVAGIQGLAEMTALKQLGLAKARLDELKGKIVDIILGSALKLVK